jgi:hypothetical protein
MGLLANTVRRLVTAGAEALSGAGAAATAADPGSLVTAPEIEDVTGGAPVGEPRRNGTGSEVDVGRLLIWETKLSNGDKFLVTLIDGKDAGAARLAMDRMAQECKSLEGVGERGLVRVKKYRKGGSEIGVNALQGRRTLSLTHTSAEGKSDPAALAGLLRAALTRL